eukprot:1158377-Pelagomonas_calceolata.AAC.7
MATPAMTTSTEAMIGSVNFRFIQKASMKHTKGMIISLDICVLQTSSAEWLRFKHGASTSQQGSTHQLLGSRTVQHRVKDTEVYSQLHYWQEA